MIKATQQPYLKTETNGNYTASGNCIAEWKLSRRQQARNMFGSGEEAVDP